MTYNFDPDQWYDNDIAFLENSFKSGRISEKEYKASLEEPGKRHGKIRTSGTIVTF